MPTCKDVKQTQIINADTKYSKPVSDITALITTITVTYSYQCESDAHTKLSQRKDRLVQTVCSRTTSLGNEDF